MKKNILSVCLWIMPCISFAMSTTDQIKSNLNAFTAYWNKGDLNKVLNSYENSQKTTLMTTPTVIKGYDQIVNYFQNNYATNEAMGKMNFSHVQIQILSSQYAMAMGQWVLENTTSKNKKGDFTFLYEKTPQGWKILTDHGF